MPTPPRIAVVDYGAGNLRSVARALEVAGAVPLLTTGPQALWEADGVVFPGQGACGSAMAFLHQNNLVAPLREVVHQGKPFLGVCLGLQLLFTRSEEDSVACLDIFPGGVRRLPRGLVVPHMGWNQVHWKRPHPVWEGIPSGSYFYFVHSYYPEPVDPSLVAGETEYGITFCSVVAWGNLVATQFHPEKSGVVGLRLYRNFVRWVGERLRVPEAYGSYSRH
ncbi:MAG: imidazole glycerol phosphate synthase subunit HisH [Dehalococcoidia bacterium]|nr:imidazole glycerol phosphate synthase subunit HisH [Dehalococcoidia bacterium]MDW8120066.1 imidazole glycerol phosphate synthase subunit HisH [Chloroflexota bacterium]